MKIIYVARHGPHDNQDEDAITYALEKLGHTVYKAEECKRGTVVELPAGGADFLLFHKWEDWEALPYVASRIPCVFWFFDLVDGTYDPTLAARSRARMYWISRVTGLCRVGFCTDGDWVARDTTGKLVHLPQGADERVAGPGTPKPGYHEILFAGMVNHGQKRASHIAELQERYGSRFGVLGDGGPLRRIHGRALADVYASAKIVLAPDGPGTDRYWSNRIFQVLGFGGFLLHPYCEGIGADGYYTPGRDYVSYRNRLSCTQAIDFYLEQSEMRAEFQRSGYERTLSHNLYRHRCERLIEVVKERLA